MSLSAHQVFMLKHFALGWRFKLANKVPGSWVTYWSLRRRGLVGAGSVLTDAGHKVLKKQLQLQSKRESNKQCQLKKEAASGQSALCCAQHQTE
jgi:hypothetical protein